MTDIDIEHLRTWVGRERVREQMLLPWPAQALGATLDREHPLAPDAALPPTWQWLYFNDRVRRGELGEDGHGKTGDFLPAVPLPRRMWAAGEFVYHQALRLGEVAEQRSRVTDVELKRGSTGPLVFVSLEHQLSQAGQCCLVEKQHLVYRAMPDGPNPLPAGEAAPEQADTRQPFQPDPVLLFRYSALTFNGHRIHYDRDYAIQREHYPALVVHGPLLATLLAEQVAIHFPDRRIATFGFRAIRPVFDIDRLQLCSRRTGEHVALWVQNQNGLLTMTAKAELEATC